MGAGKRVARTISGLLAFAVVLLAVYGAAALLSPIPTLSVDERPLASSAADDIIDSLVLPEAGATAVVLPTGDPVTAGDPAPRPIAGTAKLIFAHVLLDTEPLEVGRTGDAILIDGEDAARSRELAAAGVRTVPVLVGEAWTRRDLLAATLLGSGNNVTELLMTEVFGDVAAYRVAAAAWLESVGMTSTIVADATGLDAGNVSTAEDLAILAQLTSVQPVLTDLFQFRPTTVSTGASFSDNARFVPETGATGYVNSYTDAAGVCILLTVPVQGSTVSIALIGQPSYPAAEEAVLALIESIGESLVPVTLVAAGDIVGTYESDWDQSARLVATETVEVTTLGSQGVSSTLEIDERATVLRGTAVGQLVIESPEGRNVVLVEAADTISEPGIGWRFADPFTVFARWTADDATTDDAPADDPAENSPSG